MCIKNRPLFTCLLPYARSLLSLLSLAFRRFKYTRIIPDRVTRLQNRVHNIVYSKVVEVFFYFVFSSDVWTANIIQFNEMKRRVTLMNDLKDNGKSIFEKANFPSQTRRQFSTDSTQNTNFNWRKFLTGVRDF